MVNVKTKTKRPNYDIDDEGLENNLDTQNNDRDA